MPTSTWELDPSTIIIGDNPSLFSIWWEKSKGLPKNWDVHAESIISNDFHIDVALSRMHNYLEMLHWWFIGNKCISHKSLIQYIQSALGKVTIPTTHRATKVARSALVVPLACSNTSSPNKLHADFTSSPQHWLFFHNNCTIKTRQEVDRPYLWRCIGGQAVPNLDWMPRLARRKTIFL